MQEFRFRLIGILSGFKSVLALSNTLLAGLGREFLSGLSDFLLVLLYLAGLYYREAAMFYDLL